jgi:phenylalanyl-tRNA synthetase alpha chain
MPTLDQDIDAIRRDAVSEIASASGENELEALRIKYLARKGLIASLFEQLASVAPDLKPQYGRMLNELRSAVQTEYSSRQLSLGSGKADAAPAADLTLPGIPRWPGSRHPITSTLDEIRRIFTRMGFDLATGPEIEDDFHNFEALNFPPDHPARDMQDTFFIKTGQSGQSGANNVLLRTHTSPVQIRVMQTTKPPIRVIVPGRVYRNEAISARSYCLFHQVEGLYVDTSVTFAELKGTLVSFATQFYGSALKYRFRPSFFPFTEPSAEMDITCFICGGKGCRVCKKTGWIEILGCGMVDPEVYRHVGYPAGRYSGYAFGMGIERITMLRHGIDDIRTLFDNDIRFLGQFP